MNMPALGIEASLTPRVRSGWSESRTATDIAIVDADIQTAGHLCAGELKRYPSGLTTAFASLANANPADHRLD
jgi:hypothetical protein